MSYRVRFFAVLFSVFLAWMLGGHVVHRYVSAQNNVAQLDEAALQVVRRVEKAVDFVVTAGTEVLIAGYAVCSDPARDLLRQLVLGTGTTVDIYMVTPQGACSSFGAQSAPLPSDDVRQTWTQARNPAYRFGSLAREDSVSVGVSWGLHTDLELVSIINTDAVLFDILPDALRSNGRVHLLIDDDIVASYVGQDVQTASDIDWPSFRAQGARYPLSIEIRIDPVTLSAWRTEISLPVLVVWTVLGVMVGGSAGFAAARGRNRALEDVVRALTNQEIEPHFQPIVDLSTGNIVGCEALARWIRPDQEAVSPARFIPLVEQHGLNDALLSVMLAQAATGLRPVLEARPDFYISFNVTPDQLSRAEFAADLIALARENVLAPTQICIELTERQIIASPDAAAHTTRQLAAAGFRVAIDDAGTGHNGLAAIQQLDVGAIKIDKFFIDHVDADPRSRVMVDMFVSVARRYGMRTIAEGVETHAQRDVLKAAQVDCVQGFLYAAPVPAKKFKSALDTTWQQFSTWDATASSPAQIGPEEKRPPAAVADHPAHDPNGAAQGQTPDRELARLDALYRYQILDTDEEEVFDRIPRIARNALDVPMAAIALVDADRRWFKAVAGGQRGTLARQHSFCNRTIQRPEPTIVSDTLSDARFQSNLLVVRPPHVRAYLGVPLQTGDGHRIGSVCCVDRRPRTFTPDEVQLMRDLSSIVMEQLELRKAALFDPLTSVRSRRGFRMQAELAQALAQAEQGVVSLLMLDVDHFKQINDGYGHRVGDEVLAAMGRRLAEVVGEDALIGRMGGEEFAIALPRTALTQARHLAEQIRLSVRATPFATSRGALPVTVSLGAASSQEQHCDLDLLLEQADWALYEAKGQGRNRVKAFLPNAA